MTSPASDTRTDQLALERRVKQLEQERRELWLWVEHLERLAESGLHARGLAHDLGNALTAIMATSELASMHHDPAEDREAVDKCLAQSRKAAERLHAYVAFSRRDDATLGPVSVRTVLDDAQRFLAHPLRKAETTVETSLADAPRVAMTHPRLLQVITHGLVTLLRGARRPGGRIHITSRVQRHELVLDLRRIDGPGDGEAPSDDWRVGSTGFELHLAREILRRAGGRVRGEPDDGLTGTVRLVLPIAPKLEDETSDTMRGSPPEARAAEPSAWRAWSGGWTRS